VNTDEFPGWSVTGSEGPLRANLFGVMESPLTVTAAVLMLVMVTLRVPLVCETSSLLKLIEVGTTRIAEFEAHADDEESNPEHQPDVVS